MKAITITVRLRESEHKKLKELAKVYTDENQSLMVRTLIRTNHEIHTKIQNKIK